MQQAMLSARPGGNGWGWRCLPFRPSCCRWTSASSTLPFPLKTTGDGILATFDTPTRALRCAFGLAEAVSRLGLEIRVAIHTGEIERRKDDVGGIGVHIAARALTEAATGAVVVTRTVRDLATGTDLAFAPLGSVGLRGIPGQWELFEVSIGPAG